MAIFMAKASAASLRVFSVGFVLLTLAPFYLVLVFLLMGGVKFGFLSLNKGLAVLLAALALTYFALPRMAKKIEDGAIAFKKRKK